MQLRTATVRPGATVVVLSPFLDGAVSAFAGALRHRDHRFEWTRAEFAAWARRVADAHGYVVRLLPVGPNDPEVGPPTQLAVFNRTGLDDSALGGAATGTGTSTGSSTGGAA